MNDDPFGQYLRSRAGTIDVPATDVGVIAERAHDRRHRRHVRAARVAGALVVLGAASTAVALAGEDRTPVEVSPLDSQPSPLDWQVVTPAAGLGPTAALVPVDGVLYGLSTAPGPAVDGDLGAFRSSTLYRSEDGTEWEALALPDDIYASALSAGNGHLYAVGTGPTGGGGVPLRVATSDDGGASWRTDELDSELAGLQARYGDEVVIGRPAVATNGTTTIVATSVSAELDVESRAPEGTDLSNGWVATATGVDVYGGQVAGCDQPSDPCLPEVAQHLSFEQLQVPAELAGLVTPDVVMLASVDGAPFAPVEAPVREGYGLRLFTTAAGFTLVAQDPHGPRVDRNAQEAALIYTSVDGTAWDVRAPVPGYVEGGGVVGGAVALDTRDYSRQLTGQAIVLLADDGSRQTIDPRSVLSQDVLEQQAFVTLTGFGPLGWAAVIQTEEGGRLLVHSDPSGTVLSTVGFPPEISGTWESGITVSPDAVIVRLSDPADGDPTSPTGQVLFVGTPPG